MTHGTTTKQTVDTATATIATATATMIPIGGEIGP